MSDHFGTLCSKGLKTFFVNMVPNMGILTTITFWGTGTSDDPSEKII